MHLPGGELKLRVGTVERGGEIRKSLEPAKPGTFSAAQASPISSAPPLPPAAAPPTPLAKRGMVRRRMASGKVRCTRKSRSWIVEQVESGHFPGVCWDDAAKTMFRIPWKHAGKQDFREDQDAAIFKAWASFKEKHKDGDIGHPAVWKTRLRCALNKSSEFEEVPERGRMDVAEPYKVYRISPAGTLPNQPRNQKSPCKRSISCVSPEREENMENGRTNGVVNHSDSGSNIGGGGNGSNRSDSNSNCNSELEEGAGTTEATIREDPVFSEHQLPSNSDYSSSLTFIYGGRVVGKTQVHSLDCRLVAERSDSESSMEQVEFPKPDPSEPTQHSSNQLDRGVSVASNSRGLFVQRLCPIPISWNAPEAPPGPGPHSSPSNKCVELFKTTYFCRDLAQYFQGQGPPPKFQATLHFWEESPGSSHSQENLITVQMEQAFARHLSEKIPEEEKAALFSLQHTEQSPSASGH